jgi:hypothetical protein
VRFGKLPNELPSRKRVDHAIEVTLGMAPPTKALYWMNHEEFKVQLEKLLAKGYIKPSKPRYGAPPSSSFIRRIGHWRCVWIIKPLTRWWWRIDTHVEHLQKVFQRLKENKLYVKFKKCKFKVMEVDFFGHRITQKGLKMDDHKVKAILDWESPRLVPALRSFLRLGSYYHKFIKKLCQDSHVFDKPFEEVIQNLWMGWSM